MGEENENAGRPEEYPVETVLAVFEEGDDPCEPLTANEVADRLGCGRRTALDKLDALVERDELRTKAAGARSRVFWRQGGDVDGT